METDFDLLERAIKQLNPRCTEEEWSYLRSGLVIQPFKVREFFIEAGLKNHPLGFVVSGLLRIYYINEQGQDMTIQFVSEGGYATDYYSFITQTPSKYYFQCLEPTSLITVSYHHVQQGYERYSGLERYGRLIAEEVFKTQQQRIESFQFDSAEKRYVDFIQQNPSLFNRISLTHLSSYLGIERPSLSRIRKKIVGL